VAGLATVFGSGAMTNSIAEIEDNDVLFVIGSNTKENHPIVALRMIKAARKGAKIIVADPRKVPMVKFAHLWLQLKPGTDVALLNAIMHVIVKEGLVDKDFIDDHTEDYDEFVKAIDSFTPEKGEEITGVPKEKIIEAARLYGNSQKAGIYYTMGITQHSHGTENVFSIANLALMTGNLGKESAGVNPLRGQNNVQGSTDMGCIPNMYPGYQKVDVPPIKAKFEKEWNVSLSDAIGMTATEMVDAATKGELKALYIMGENPVMSDPDIAHTKKAFANLDFLVVQDIFMTETAEMADVVLPAVSFAAKEGTFTNTERRVQRVRRAITPPGDSWEDSRIIMELSGRMGYKMKYANMEEVFIEIGNVWPALAGINYTKIRDKGVQWPCPTPDHPGTQFLFKGGFPRGKGRFTPISFRESAELPDKEYPFILTTGRQLFHYHTGTMTRRIEPLNIVSPDAYVEIHPQDAARLAIEEGSKVRVISRRGEIRLRAVVRDVPGEGTVFIPFHFKEAAANVLTNTAYDPVCKIPELKVCAVRIEKA
jgi:formate dehydrogenase alpha subunit